MNKKNIPIFLIIITIIIVCICSIKTIRSTISDTFWGLIIKQLDKEEQERQQKIANGEIVRGKDTVLIWENMYEIGHYSDGEHLTIYVEGISDNILEKIIKHKVVKNKLYVLSKEGFAVIYKNNICKVFVTVPEDEFVKGYSTDESGNRTYISRYVEDEHVQYLSDFSEFADEEQKVFNKLKE